MIEMSDELRRQHEDVVYRRCFFEALKQGLRLTRDGERINMWEGEWMVGRFENLLELRKWAKC